MTEQRAELLTPLQPQSFFDRLGKSMREAIHAHTPEGRRQEYLKQWQHVLEGINGLPRFELEKRLNDEAGKYTRDRVVRDVLIVAGATAGVTVGAVGVNELRKRDWKMGKLFSDLGAKVTNWTKEAVTNAAAGATKLGLEGVTKAIIEKPDLITDLTSRATQQAVVGVQKATGFPDVQGSLTLAGFNAADAAIGGAEKAVEAHATSAPDRAKANILNFLSNILSLATGNK